MKEEELVDLERKLQKVEYTCIYSTCTVDIKSQPCIYSSFCIV